MISQDQILNLPEDPQLAFAEYVRLLKKVVDAESNDENDRIEKSFVTHVRAFVDTHDVNFELPDLEVMSNDFWKYYAILNDELDYYTAKTNLQLLRSTNAISTMKIEFSGDYRDQIHVHLDKVRKIVNAVSIEERLRENIFIKTKGLYQITSSNYL